VKLHYGFWVIVLFGFFVICVGACQRNDMWDQPKIKTLGESEFFDKRQAALQPVPGTVARGYLMEDDFLYKGIENNEIAKRFPFPITRAVLERGRDRYNIFCSPCHGRTGNGLGMIVQRGYKQPASFHEERLRKAPPGYFFDVFVSGFEAAKANYEKSSQTKRPKEDVVHPVLSKQLKAEDRWAIIAYIRALQLSQNVPVTELSPEERKKLEKGTEQEVTGGTH